MAMNVSVNFLHKSLDFSGSITHQYADIDSGQTDTEKGSPGKYLYSIVRRHHDTRVCAGHCSFKISLLT